MAALLNITDRGSFVREVADFPVGVSDDGVIGFTIGGKKYVRNRRRGSFESEELGIWANGTDMTAKLQARLNHSSVKKVIMDAEGGGDIIVNGVLNIPSGKILKFRPGTRITGTGTITGKVDAPDSAEIFATTLNLNSVEPARGYLPVAWYGVKGDGVTDNATAFTKLATNSKATDIRFNLPSGSNILFNTSSISFSGKVLRFEHGNKITGTGILSNPTFDAPVNSHILDTTVVMYYPKSASGKFSVRWLGAKGDGVTDDTAVFQRLTHAVAAWSPLTIYIPSVAPGNTTSTGYVINGSIVTNGNSVNKIWEFEPGAYIKGTGTINGISIRAHARFKIFENTLTLTQIGTDNGQFSVRWVGAGFGTSNTTDDTAAVQKAADSILEGQTLYFPWGTYYLNGPVITARILGDGRRTFLKPTSAALANTPVLRIGRHSVSGDVGLADIREFVVDGTLTNYGIEFNNGGNNDQYSGRWRFVNVIFMNCVRSVSKPRGNFGNVFDGCNFSGTSVTEFHYHAMDEPGMHTGLDKFYNCRFYGARKAAAYINDEEGGGTRFQDCVFEYNYGFAVFIKVGGANNHVLPVVINNCWLESNGHGETNAFDDPGGVEIDGVVYTKAYDYHFESCNAVKMENTALGRVHAIRSNVFIDTVGNGSSGGSYVDKDADSVVVMKSEFGFTNEGKVFNFDGMSLAKYNGIGRVKTGFPKGMVPAIPTTLNSVKFNTLTGLTFSGSFTKTIVDDGPLTGKSLEISNITSSGYIDQAVYTTAVDKYYVVGLGVKLVSGPQAFIVDANSGKFVVTEKDAGAWRYYYQVFKGNDAFTRKLYMSSVENAGSVFRISCWQVNEFNSRQDAYEFIQNSVFYDSNPDDNVLTAKVQTITNKTLGIGTKINLGTVAAGDLYYGGADGTLIRIPAGANGQALIMVAGVPTWVNPGGVASSESLVISTNSNHSIGGSGNLTVIHDGLTADRTETLPDPASSMGRVLTIVHSGNGAFDVVLSHNIKITGSTTVNTVAQGITRKLMSDGVDYWQVN